jgi:protein gp37
MPDGQIASCYADDLAARFDYHYQKGFRHHYWHPKRLAEPLKHKKPLGIFLGSMGDLFGNWVPDDDIHAVLQMCADADWHTFFTLTKNPGKMHRFEFPANVWVGCSLPGGPLLSEATGRNALMVYLRHMANVNASVRWISLEPLWFDVAPILRQWIENGLSLPLDWAVIGAASNGRKYYQPKSEWVQRLLDLFDWQGIPVFMKGNLDWGKPSRDRRKDFPVK